MTKVTGLRPWRASYSSPRLRAVSCRLRIISMVSDRLASDVMTNLPVTLPCSGASKNRHGTSPRTSAADWTARSSTPSASVG